MKSKISVFIPCFNYGCFLSEAIDSVLIQTRLPLEILICDDCSTDNTSKIAVKYQKKYPNLIRYFRNKKNLGIIKNFNQAVDKTKGEYICLLDADNRFTPNYLEKTADILDKNPDVAIAYTDFKLFGSESEKSYKTFNPKFRGKIYKDQTYVINFPEFTKRTTELQKTNNFIHGSSLYRKNAYIDAGKYKQHSILPEDHFLFLRIIQLGWKAKRVSSTILEYRQHSINQANIKNQTKIKIKQYREKYKNIGEFIDQIEELNEIKDSKFYKLWPIYCQVKKIFIK